MLKVAIRAIKELLVFDSFKLDETTLTHLTYHWFWGLRYSKTPKPVNLGVEISRLVKDESKLADIINSQVNLYIDHNAMVRFFYWLFNINNYTYHAYLLAACKGHQNYLYPSSEKGTSMTTPYNIGWGILASGMVAGLGYAGRRIYRFLTDAAEASPTKKATDDVASNALVKLQETSAAKRDATPERADVESVIVTASMLPHLEVLGINLSPGDSLNLSDFKSTCRARYLASHPDKPGGTPEVFRCVREAAESLITIMSSRDHSRKIHPFKDDPDKYWADFNACLDEIRANIAMFKAKIAEANTIRAENRVYRDENRAYRAETKIQVTAALRDLEVQMREQQRGKDIPISSGFSAIGAPGLFAPDSVRAEGQEELHEVEPGAEGSNTCH